MVYWCSGKPLSNKKNWTTDTSNNVDESEKYYVKWQKTDKRVLMYDSNYKKLWNRQNSRGGRNQISGWEGRNNVLSIFIMVRTMAPPQNISLAWGSLLNVYSCIFYIFTWVAVIEILSPLSVSWTVTHF